MDDVDHALVQRLREDGRESNRSLAQALIVPLLGRDRQHLAELFGETLPQIAGVENVRGHLVLDVLRFESKWASHRTHPTCSAQSHHGR